MIFHSNQVIFICGRRRSGKSYLAVNLFFRRLQRVILHDRKHEHNHLKATYCHTPDDILSAWNQHHDKIVYQPYDPSIEDFNEVCRYIFYHGNCTLIVDEAASYSQPMMIPHWYAELIRLGTIRGIGVISLSQRPRALHNTIISEADFIFAFQLQLETDRHKVAETVGPEAEKLNMIPRHHFLLYNSYEGVSWHSPILTR